MDRKIVFYVIVDYKDPPRPVYERSPLDSPLTMRNLLVGEDFVYGEHIYTKTDRKE